MAFNQQQALLDGDRGLDKKDFGERKLTESQQSALLTTKIVLAVLSFISGAAAIGVVLGLPASFNWLKLSTVTDYRNGPFVSSDGYPNSLQSAVGLASVGLIAAFVSILGAIGYILNAAFHSSEVEQLNRGANPWFWVFSALWTPLAFLVWQFVSGIVNVFVHTLLFLAVWGWIFCFWNDDLLNSYSYKAVVDRYANRSISDASTWSWVPLVQGLIFAIVSYVIVFIYLGATFSAEVGPSGTLLVIPITGMALYLLLVPVVLILYRAKLLVTRIYYREMALYIGSQLVILVATWLTLLILFAVAPEPVEDPII